MYYDARIHERQIRGAIVPLQCIPSGYMLDYSTGTAFRLLNVPVGLYVHKYIRVCITCMYEVSGKIIRFHIWSATFGMFFFLVRRRLAHVYIVKRDVNMLV